MVPMRVKDMTQIDLHHDAFNDRHWATVIFECEKCRRHQLKRIIVEGESMKLFRFGEALQQCIDNERPRCDCDRARCRIGAQYQRACRTIFTRKR